MSVALLPPSTIRLVTTTQIITTVSSVVKELLENSLDAGATNIEIKLERNGLERIEIKDNGCGIKASDIENVCLSSYTSKIQDYSDLANLCTYGFRGEALSSLCQVSSMAITTKTASDNVAMTYTINQDGSILNSKPSHFGNGTHIIITDLFKNLPVRKQYLSNSRNASEDLKRTEHIVKSMAVIHPNVRITFCHNKSSLWQKPVVSTLKESFMQIFGYSTSSKLEQLLLRKDQINFELLIPMKNCSDIAALCQTSSSSIMVYTNKRPIKYSKIEKVISKITREYFGAKLPSRKHPLCVVSLSVPANLIDVNLEPNKTKVLCKDEDLILSSLKEMLVEYYGLQEDQENIENCKQPDLKMNRKLNSQPDSEEDKACKRLKLSSGSNISEKTCITVPDSSVPMDNLTIENNTASQHFPDPIIMHDNVENMQTCNISYDKQQQTKNWINSSLNENSSLFVEKSLELQQSADVGPSHDKKINSPLDESSLSENTQILVDNLSVPENSAVSKAGTVLSEEEEDRNSVTSIHLPEVQITGCDRGSARLGVSEQSDTQNGISLGVESNLCNLLEDAEDLFFGFDTPEIVASQKEKEKLQQSLDAMKALNNKKVVKSTSLEDLDQEKWSRGEIKTKDGTIVEGAKLLLPKVNKNKKDFFNLSLHSVSSQMGCKEQSAFTKFSRHMRPKLLEENPGIAFTKVASLLVEHWQRLTNEEKSKFEEMAQEEEERKQNNPIKKNNEKISSPNIKEMLSTVPKKITVPEDIHSVEGIMACSLSQIKNQMEDTALKTMSSNANSEEISLIGQIRPQGTWLYMKNGEIGIVRHWALQETAEFHKMMRESSVPLIPIMNKIPLKPSALGADLWNIFITLEHSYDNASSEIIISSPFITKNGFRITITEGAAGDAAFISHVASTVRFYSVVELKEILEILKVKGLNCALEDCRPLKIINYFKSEAVATCRKAEDVMCYSELTDHLRYWEQNVKHKSLCCLHKNPIFVPFFTFSS